MRKDQKIQQRVAKRRRHQRISRYLSSRPRNDAEAEVQNEESNKEDKVRFSLKCTEHDDAEVADDSDEISIDAMGASEFEIDVSDVHCTVFDDLSSEEQDDEDNACKIVITAIADNPASAQIEEAPATS